MPLTVVHPEVGLKPGGAGAAVKAEHQLPVLHEQRKEVGPLIVLHMGRGVINIKHYGTIMSSISRIGDPLQL